MSVELLGRPPPKLGSGRFAIVDELGEGGTATVYLAWDQSLDRWVALKALQHKHLGDHEIRRRFSQEAEALARFDHPNIPHLFAYHPDTSPPYMVMELARCGSAMDWLRRNGPMPPELAAEIIDQVCEALDAAHLIGILHRDVKPHNVLLDDHGMCKLTDFGIARLDDATSFTATGTQIGTFSFMAPEQRSDTKSVDQRADVYSVGASLFTLLTARTSAELFVAVSEDDLLADIPPALREVILGATRYRPEERYGTVRELKIGLRAAMMHVATTPGRLPPLVDPPDRLPEKPPALLAPGRRFLDLERSLALDSNQPTFVPARARDEASLFAFSSVPVRAPELQDVGLFGAKTRVGLSKSQQSRSASGASKSQTSRSGRSATAELGALDEQPLAPSAVERSVRWLAYGVGAGALSLVGSVVILAAGLFQVSSARYEADVAGDALVSALARERDLGEQLGSQRFVFERCYDDFVGQTEPELRRQRAHTCVALLEEAGSTELADEVRERLHAIRDLNDEAQRAVDTWETLATTFPGSWATSVGLARAP